MAISDINFNAVVMEFQTVDLRVRVASKEYIIFVRKNKDMFTKKSKNVKVRSDSFIIIAGSIKISLKMDLLPIKSIMYFI
tara:strand:- start:32 stop:271 length:240 start_codon:yes stop_codon:yes gene_type:complete